MSSFAPTWQPVGPSPCVSRARPGAIWAVLRMVALTLALLGLAITVRAAPAASAVAPSATSPTPTTGLQGNKVLVVAPEASRVIARELAGLLTDHFAWQVSVLASHEYVPGVDERAHDGFVYLGAHFGSPPPAGLLADMARTTKPVLWIGYHAWLLDAAFLRGRGLRIEDRHSNRYVSVVLRSVEPLPATDTTWVEAPDEAVISWLYDASRLHALPGAVRVGNFGFVSYFPSLDAKRADFPAFRAALQAVFGPRLRRSARAPFTQRVEAARADRFRTGIHLPIYVAGTTGQAVGYDSERLHAKLARIRETGAEWVTVAQIHFQDGIAGTEIRADPVLTAGWPSLANIVRDAQAIGLLVRLSIVVNLAEGTERGDEWRGMIRPANAERWWAAYRKLVLQAAAFAREHEVESLTIGAELNTMQTQTARWRDLARAVRDEAGYRGLVGYQVNFNALDTVAWADAIDYLAIAAYWPLAGNRDAPLSELSASWARIAPQLAAAQRRHPRLSIEFGEIGYVSQPYAAVLPYSWKPDRRHTRSVQEQLRCYQALERFLASHPVVAGVHFFASTIEDFDPRSIGYTPFGKPAAEVMTRILRSR